jgi:beta-galactosidase
VRLASERNLVTVKVDNLYHPNIPPTVKSDYNFYGGIYRYTWLRITEPTYIRDVSWTTPAVSERLAELHIESHIVNTLPQRREMALVQEVFSPDQALTTRVSSAVELGPHETVSVVQRCDPITRPRLWTPGEPHLCRIVTSITAADRPIDCIETPLGFRWYHFDPQKGLIFNGRRVQIQGTNWHQVYPGMGNALPKSRH